MHVFRPVMIMWIAVASSSALDAVEQPVENMLTNGDFEAKPRLVSKSSNSYIFAHVQDGWDFGEGPFAKLAPGWTPNVGAATLRVVTAPVADAPENHALMLATTDQGCHIYAQSAPAGKYIISFEAKGNGGLAYCIYCYRENSGKKEMLKTLIVLRADLGESWKSYRLTFDTRELLPEATVFTSAFGISENSKIYLDNVSLSKNR